MKTSGGISREKAKNTKESIDDKGDTEGTVEAVERKWRDYMETHRKWI